MQPFDIFPELWGHFGFHQADGTRGVLSFKTDIKPWLAPLQDQVLFYIIPFKSPHQRTGPNMNGKSPPDHHSGQGRAPEMTKWWKLGHIDRLICYEKVRSDNLQDWPIWMPPLFSLYY